ncbi:metal ABC transporter permease [Tetragenococcus muriaticus]|uniref:metal ABC transporter permease n=1 Tax=Tetragenococcus muriaticus TaxID=64642 RepID=UPI000407F240|nr:metal ABC transporter permease [Tetragenococcus muriaticus]GMA46046.1 zinc ABC transporter permease [Tetragenococcus muriaticus]GMA47358.1 zinc ABC transporter permease [Tetragenococcus muriaticus]
MGALLVLVITALACSLVGVFLVLRNLAMVSDAISHTVLLGIVAGYFVSHDLDSPLLFIGAALFGVLTVYAIEALVKKFRLKNDAATGLVFPLFFAIAIIIISKFARNVHLDIDIVLSGEVVFASLNTLTIFGLTLPRSFVEMSVVFLLNLLFVVFFYQKLKISTFDAQYAASIGIAVSFLHFILMTLVSTTTVVAFNAVGSILVISFLVAPVLSAYLLAKRLYAMILLSMIYGTINSVVGYMIAIELNMSMPGMCATVAFITFMFTFIFYPNGLIGKQVRRYQLRKLYQINLLVLYLPVTQVFKAIDLSEKLEWSESQTEKLLDKLMKKNYVERAESGFYLTSDGQAYKNQMKLENH